MVLRSMKRPALKPRLQVEYKPPRKIAPRARNPRLHSEDQIGKLMESIREFGFVAPILVDGAGEIIAGHGRLEAAKRLGFEEVPVIVLRHLSPAQIKALVIADNQLASLSKWDDNVLRGEVAELFFDETIDFSPTVTGFEAPEIDTLLFSGDFQPEGQSDPADAIAPEPPRPQPITQSGDIWRSDTLSLVCGDALKRETYEAALQCELAQLVLSDPPYGVKIQGHVAGRGKRKYREFLQGAGDMSEDEFIAFLTLACEQIKRHAAPGALAYLFMDGVHLYHLFSAARAAGLSHKALCTWAKTNAGLGSFYRSQTEHVAVFKTDEAKHANNIKLGRFGRNRTTLWSYPGANTFGRNRNAALDAHPTCKPVALLADAILDASAPKDLVLDPFAGSGSTLIAAHRVGRRAAGIELDPLYVDGALARIAKVTGEDLVRKSDGARWSKLAKETGQ